MQRSDPVPTDGGWRSLPSQQVLPSAREDSRLAAEPLSPNANAKLVSIETAQHSETAHTIAALASGLGLPGRETALTSRQETVEVVFASIGLGIGSAGDKDPVLDDDATDAAAKAVADAVERGQLRAVLIALQRPKTAGSSNPSSGSPQLTLRVTLGVPPSRGNPNPAFASIRSAMAVDAHRLRALLPANVPLLPLEVTVGGLRVPRHPCQPGLSSTIAVVASVSVELCTGEGGPLSAKTPVSNVEAGHLWQSPAGVQPLAPAPGKKHGFHAEIPTPAIPGDSLRPPVQAAAAVVLTSKANDHRAQPANEVPLPSASPTGPHSTTNDAYQHANKHTVCASPSTLVNRTNSMDVLARISAEMHEEHQQEQQQHHDHDHCNFEAVDDDCDRLLYAEEGQAENSDGDHLLLPGLVGSLSGKSASATSETSGAGVAAAAYNYRKLPPGVTPKKNQRLFVKHRYRDHSAELPRSDELELLAATATASSTVRSGPPSPGSSPPTLPRTPNAAFPLKLHETLKQIELDGLDHILGWLPHGRSFKIFQQKEFVESILPRYFVMTKKSSFLRQLNLYGFNRLSGLGPDQGSYYHEKFLRGMKFLSKRMQRQKVNGNGIRAAGDPDSEPNLRLFPPCPPRRLGERVLQPPPLALAHLVLPLAPPLPLQASSPPAVSPPQPVPPVMVLAEAASAAAEATSAPASSGAGPKRKKAKSSSIILPASVPSIVSSPGSSSSGQVIGASSCGVALSLPEASDDLSAGGPGGLRGVQVSFPLKLQRILDKLEADGETDVVGWLPHGRAFLVYDPSRFVNELMPRFFNQSKFSSFQRQLHMYSFNRITASGRDKGAYHHPHFVRGHPHWAVQMRRTRINGKGTRKPGNPNTEPDFYGLPRVPPVPRGSMIEIPAEPGAGGSSAATIGGGTPSPGNRTGSPSSAHGATTSRHRRRLLPIGRHPEEPANEKPVEENVVEVDDAEDEDGDDYVAPRLDDQSSYGSESDPDDVDNEAT